MFLTKPRIALQMIDRALSHGVVVKAWTFDELYGANGPFLNAVEERGQIFIAEVPSTFYGWTQRPPLTSRPAKTRAKTGKNKRKRQRSGKAKGRVKTGHAASQFHAFNRVVSLTSVAWPVLSFFSVATSDAKAWNPCEISPSLRKRVPIHVSSPWLFGRGVVVFLNSSIS